MPLPRPGADGPLTAGDGAVRTPDVPELLSNDPNGYAWHVLRDRTPKIVNQIRDAHPYGPHQRQALDQLLDEINSGTIRPLDSDAHDRAIWDTWGAEYFGKPWADVPFLWWESYFYRRLLGAVEFFSPGPWFWVDPFEYLKTAELWDPVLEIDLVALNKLRRRPEHAASQAKLLLSLWGNRADLGFRIGKLSTDSQKPMEDLIADHSARLWSVLNAGTDNRVCIVADNAGRELLSDLILIDHLFEHGMAAEIALHVKPHPYYVSDAVTADVVACLRRLAVASGDAATIARRLWEAVGAGRFTLYTHAFYCAPWSFHYMPADLAEEFASASLTVLKGDLNHRRLVGDRSWPPGTPFAEATGYFPGPVAALRTLKSDVVVGIDAATLSALDASEPSWRTSGAYGLVQVRL